MSTILITVDANECDRLFAATVQAPRKSVGASVSVLAKASGIARLGIEAIECGRPTTPMQRRDISVALGRLVNKRSDRGRQEQDPYRDRTHESSLT